MKDFKLSQEEIAELRAAHKKEKQKKKAYRLNAVILLGTGWTIKQVSEALLLDEDTLSTYVKKYKEGGFPNLLKSLYQGSKSFLNQAQTKLLCEELDFNVHLTTSSIQHFVEKSFDIRYSRSGITNLLHQLGFTYKKPKLVPANVDRQAKEEESEEGQAVQEHSTAYKATVCLVAAIFSSCLQFAFICITSKFYSSLFLTLIIFYGI